MGPNFRWKVIVVAAVLAVSAWYLWPTVQYHSLSDAQRAAMDSKKLASLRGKAIRLGLDLQGGMHLVLQVDKSKLSEKEAADAVDRALEVVRNRVDQFGVTEPSIQRQGDDRIIVQLPGIQEIERAKELIGQTALLEFKILQPVSAVQDASTRVDALLAARRKMARAGAVPDTAAAGDMAAAAADTSGVDSLLAGATEDDADAERQPFSRFLGFSGRSDQDNPLVLEENVPKVQAILADPEVQRAIPSGSVFAWGRDVRNLEGESYRDLYLLRKNAEMTGAAVQNAIVQIGLDEDNPNAPGVELTMTRAGQRTFARVTGENVGKRMAIVLDGQVHSAPNIRERIPRGVASIAGAFTDAEAKVLAIVLRAGALPAPIEILEERSVGPSLGKDSIDAGVRACWIGTSVIFLFMLFYYRLTGLVANVALVLNLILLISAMVAIDATLTLPGIAGIALTLGMAVDANVLINERIREELRLSKTIRAAVDAGYSRAFRTIIDSHATTLLTTFFLLFYGTASIKGFAVTLAVGLAISMFTSVFVTRIIMDLLVDKFRLRRLSI
jgi:protein-export membrane protein SecD